MVTAVSKIPYSQLSAEDNFLQSAVWAEFKEAFGWQAAAYRYGSDSLNHQLLVLIRKIGPLRLAYVPHGPELSGNGAVEGEDRLEEWGRRLAELARLIGDTIPRDVMVLRFDPPWRLGDELSTEAALTVLARAGFRLPRVRVQVPTTVIIDLTAPEEEMLSRMKSKTRYNVRLAEKRGVEVEAIAAVEALQSSMLRDWYDIYRATARRDQISIHPFAYYEKLLAVAGRERSDLRLRLYLARHEGDLLGGIIVGYCGRMATYLYGASADVKRNLMAAYGLQWRAMRDARAAGCTSYDLFGIPPTDDPKHPMSGLYRFKTGFGGAVVRRPGLVDVPRRKAAYAAYRFVEDIRDYYHKHIRKRRN